MQSLSYISGSDGTANASLMTIQSVRSPGASTILVNTVAGVPTKFYGSMGTPHTFTDPVTSETITVVSEATAVDFAGHVDGGNIEIDAIAPGYTDNGSQVGDVIIVRPVTEWANNLFNVLNESHNDDGSIKNSAVVYEPTVADHIESGGTWSILSALDGAMTAATVYQGGNRGELSAVASRAFTASKDTYVDILRTESGYTQAFTLVYTEVANGAAAPALAANSVRMAKVVTNASAITTITQTGIDSLENVIYPSGAVSKSDINQASFGAIQTTGTGANTMSMTITEPGLVMIIGTARIGTATGGVTLTATGSAYVSGNILQNQQNDADYEHFTVGGFVVVKPGTLTFTIGGVDNKGMVAAFIPLLSRTLSGL